MADTSLSATYTTTRRVADRDELLRWREETLAQPPAPAPAAPAAPGGEKKPEPSKGIAAVGVSTAWDTFQQGAQNVADAIYSKTPQSVGTSVGQGVLGALQFAAALPAGAGASVREAVKKYAPGMESATAIAGGQNSAAGFIRTALGAPGLLLDPKMKTADPRAIAEAINEPMTYGELIDVLTQFAAPVIAGKAVKGLRGKGGAPPEQPASPARPPSGSPKALPERTQPLVTPPPGSGEGMAGGMTPTEVAIELRTALERVPHPEPARAGIRPYQDPVTLLEGPTPDVPTGIVDAQGRPVAAPVVEALAERERLRAFERTPLDAPPRTAKSEGQAIPDRSTPTGDLGTVLDRTMQRAEKALGEELQHIQARVQEAKKATAPRQAQAQIEGLPKPEMPDTATRAKGPQADIKDTELFGQERAAVERSQTELPERTADTMSEAIALSSPSGQMSGSAQAAAQERLRVSLFGKEGLQPAPVPQPTEVVALRRQAQEMRELAERGMSPVKHQREAERLETRATLLETAAEAGWTAKEAKAGQTGKIGYEKFTHPERPGEHINSFIGSRLRGPDKDKWIHVGNDGGIIADGHGQASFEQYIAKTAGPAQEITPGMLDALSHMWGDLKEAAPGQRFLITDDVGKVEGGLSQPSTYPQWLEAIAGKKTRQNADKIMAAIDNVMDGKVEGKLEQSVVQWVTNNWQRIVIEREGSLGDAGRIDPALLARMAVGAAAGGSQGDTPEERVVNAFLGMGLGAALSKRLAVKLKAVYKDSGLADESGALDFSKWRQRPAVQASEQPFQPNYRRLALTPELKRFSVNLHRMMADEILARKGPVKTEESTVIAARKLIADGDVTAERLLNLDDQAMLSREEMTAARMIGQRSRDYSFNLNEAFKAGQVSGEEFMDAFAVAAAISKNVRVAQTRTAQALQASHIKVGVEHPSAYRPDDVIRLADDLARNATPEQLSQALDSIEAAPTRQKVMELAGVLPRAFLEVMYFSYLSGKATLRNAVGGLVMPPVAMADMALAPYMIRWGKAAQTERVLPGSATQMFTAYQESMLDMFHMLKFWDPAARKRLAGLEEEVAGGRQLESRYAPAFTSENMPVLGPAADLLGTVFRLPGHILGTTDAMAKMVNARMWQRFEAFHQASREGVAGPELATRIDRLMDDPTQLSDLARERIQDFTERQTFTKDLEGSLLGPLQRGPENPWLNAAYRWQVLPFFRTPARAMETGLLHTPVLNLTMTKFWQDMGAGGQAQQIAQSKLVFGTAIMSAFAYLESRGGLTGDGPDDPKLRKQWQDELGWQRRSWWDVTAGKWRSYDGIAPISDWMAAGADMSAAARRTPGDLGAMALAAGLAMATAFDTKAYTQTLSDWFSFMRPGTSDDTMAERFVSLQLRRLQGVANPGVLRELETAADPEIRRARPSGASAHVISRELDVLKRNWMSQIPGLSSLKDAEGFYLTPPDRDRIDGAPTVVESAPFVPFPSRTPKADPLKQHIFGELQGAGLAPWPEWIGGGRPTADIGIGTREAENVTTGVRMTPQEKDIYVRLFTQETKDGLGRTYRQALEAAVADPNYQRQSTIGPSGTARDSGQARWLQRIDHGFHQLTAAALRAKSSTLDKEIVRKEQERMVRSVPTAEQGGVRQMLQQLTR